jgi:2-amino-4-hydroxy-6-hydroxymethyldihydropteridine diphosphokinase
MLPLHAGFAMTIRRSQAISAYIALGSNLGDRAANIRAAVARLATTKGIAVIRLSSLLENPAVGGPKGSPAFLNAAVHVETTLTARALLDRLLEIEAEMGRVRRERWEPRVIDLDLLLYGEQVINEPGLVVPHPEMHKRGFVLRPLCEIAPDIVHPVLRQRIRDLLDELAK